MVARAMVAGMWLALMLFAAPASALLSVEVDRNPVAMNESCTVTFTARGDATSEEPDFSPLERDFHILRKHQQSNYSIVNGRTDSSLSYELVLVPKRAGDLVIPPVRFGSETRKAVPLTVVDSGKGSNDAQDIFIEVTVDSPRAYVHSQVLMTVKLYVGVKVSNASLSEPEHANAVVELLGEAKNYEKLHEGRRLHVIERRYAIFAQQSGELAFPPLVFSAEVRQGGFFQAPRFRRVMSEPVTLDILPVPTGVDSASWLPAQALRLTEEWPEDPPRFKAGEPVTRTLMLSARGLTAAQLPPLIDEDGYQAMASFKLYPDQPQLDNRDDDAGVVGIRVERIAMLPTQAGEVTLPEVRVPWWDTAKGQMQYAVLPARQVTVVPGSLAQSTPPPAPLTSPAPVVRTPEPVSEPPVQPAGRDWRAVSIGLGAGWAITAIVALAGWLRRKPARPAVPGSHADGAGTRAASAQQELRELRRACQVNDARSVRARLLSWAAAQWPADPPRTLAQLGRRGNRDFVTALQGLERTLYGPSDADAGWSASGVMAGVEQCLKAPVQGRRGSGADYPLASL